LMKRSPGMPGDLASFLRRLYDAPSMAL